ncbi:MAG: DMT family transporter [Pseudomonadota bacterium]
MLASQVTRLRLLRSRSVSGDRRDAAATVNEAPGTPRLRAIVLMLSAVACFPLMQTCVKSAMQVYDLHFLQVAWGRYFFHLLLVPLLFPGTLRSVGQTRRPITQLARGLTLFLATVVAFVGVKHLPLPEFTALTFIAPILVTALAALVLRERVNVRRWLAVIAGFVGVLIIIQPQAGFGWAATLPLIMAAFYAVYQVLTRLSRDDVSPGVSLFYTALIGAVVASLIVPLVWQWPELGGWALLIGAAAFGAAGHFLMIKAYERAEASFIAPFAYTELVWAALAGWVIFGDVIGLYTVCGAVVIVAAGWYVAKQGQ